MSRRYAKKDERVQLCRSVSADACDLRADSLGRQTTAKADVLSGTRQVRYSGPGDTGARAEAIHRRLDAEIPKFEAEVRYELAPVAELLSKCTGVSAADRVMRLGEAARRAMQQKLTRFVDAQGARMSLDEDWLSKAALSLAYHLLEAASANDTSSVVDKRIKDTVWVFTFPLEPGRHDETSAAVIAASEAKRLDARAWLMRELQGVWYVELCFRHQAKMEKAWSSIAETYADRAHVEHRPGVGPSPIVSYSPKLKPYLMN